MPLIGLFGALALVAIASIWAGLKLVVYVLKADNSEEAFQFVSATMGLTKPWFLAVVGIVAALELWPGIARWSTGAFELVIQLW